MGGLSVCMGGGDVECRQPAWSIEAFAPQPVSANHGAEMSRAAPPDCQGNNKRRAVSALLLFACVIRPPDTVLFLFTLSFSLAWDVCGRVDGRRDERGAGRGIGRGKGGLGG